MKESVGDHHWLGDGVYFYRDFIYALRWIRCKDKTEKVLERYSIISANLEVDEGRVFSFQKLEHKLIFQKVVRTCQDRLKKLDPKKGIVDGAILNIMFKMMEYGNDFDMVEAMFIHEDKSMIGYNSRLYYLPEVQVCVKNIDIIKDLEKREIAEEELSQNLLFIDNFRTKASGVLETKDMKYTAKKKNKSYKR